VSAFLGDDQCPLELPGVGRIDAEIGGQLHGAADALRHEHEGAVREDGRVQGGIEIVPDRHDRTEVALHELRVILHGLGEGAEDHSRFAESLLEGGRDRYAVEDGIHGYAGEPGALVQGDTELVVGLEKLGIDVVQAPGAVGLVLRGRVVGNGLEVDGRVVHPGPPGLLHPLPVPEGLEAPVEHELRLALDRGDQANDVLVQPRGQGLAFDVRDEAVPVLAGDDRFDVVFGACHQSSGNAVRHARRASGAASPPSASRAGPARECGCRERSMPSAALPAANAGSPG
jgi:hypothetical protein